MAAARMLHNFYFVLEKLTNETGRNNPKNSSQNPGGTEVYVSRTTVHLF